MYREKEVGVVVPAYNEEALIGRVLETMPGYVDHIFIVDDCSNDQTIEKACSYNDPRIVIIRHSHNKGVGAAIVSGYRQALKNNIDLIAVMAGDHQMDPLELPGLLEPVANQIADYSKGDRLSRSDLSRGMGKWRRFGNYLLTLLTRISSGYWKLQDPQNGYTVISREALQRIDLSKVYPGYGYCNDLLVKLNVLGLSVIDVQIPARYGEERSTIRYGKYIRKVSLLLLSNFVWRIFNQYQHPILRVPGITYPAAFALCFGGLAGVFAGLMGNMPFFLGTLALTSGTLLLFFSILFEISSQNDGRYQERSVP